MPTFVYVFKNPEAMSPYLPRVGGKPANVGAYFLQTRDGNFIALSAKWNSDPRPIVYHEFIHDFLRANFPPQPAWYEEGAADYYSTFQTDGNEARTGMIRDDYLALLRSTGLMPLDRLFAVDHDSPEYNEELRQGIFYAQSWALVHYLMQGAPERAPQLGRFLQLLQQGRPRNEAFREAFGAEYSVLFSELVGYIRNKRFTYNRFRFAELKFSNDATVAPLTEEDTRWRLADLLAHGDADRLTDAARYCETVLASAPRHAGALAGLGFVRLRQERWEEAGALYRRAIAAGSQDFRVFFHRGRLLWEELTRETRATRELDPKTRQLLDETRAAFRRAIALNPDFAEARVALGRTYLLDDGGPPDEGIAALEAARSRLPGRDDVAADLAELYDRKGEKEKGDALLEGAAGPEAEQARTRREARSELEKRIDAINDLLQAGKEQEALAALDGVIALTDGEIRVEMEAQRETLRKTAARNRSVDAYNAAIALYNERDYERALAAFQKLAAESPDPELAASAKARASEVSRLVGREAPKP